MSNNTDQMTSGEFEDPDFFQNVQTRIEKELAKLKKIVNDINQMRVETAYLESDLLLTIDVTTWKDISEFIGLTTSEPNADTAIKNEF